MDLFCGSLWMSTLKKLPKDAPKIAKRITMMAVKISSPNHSTKSDMGLDFAKSQSLKACLDGIQP